MATALRKVWGSLTSWLLQKHTDRRQLQLQIDTHRLYLLTSYHATIMQGDAAGQEGHAIADRAKEVPFEEQQSFVQDQVHKQVLHLFRSLKDVLEPGTGTDTTKPADEGSDANVGSRASEQPAARKRPSGLSFAVGGHIHPIAASGQEKPDRQVNEKLTIAETATKLADRLGFQLEVKPSSVPHRDAGEGLYVSGSAPMGAVLAFYPGVVYKPSLYRYMPGYPLVGRDNPYLISRFDGAVIDGRPWGKGGHGREWWSGLDPKDAQWCVKERAGGRSMGATSEGKGTFGKIWDAASGGNPELPEEVVQRTTSFMERRNPLAFAHFANHPGRGTKANVMLCAYDFHLTTDSHQLRPYIPNVMLGGWGFGKDFRRSGVLWVQEAREDSEGDREANKKYVPALVLVTTRDVRDEEIFLNYRLSSATGRPEWYSPVDAEEDRRRWA